jgi:phytol kinase
MCGGDGLADILGRRFGKKKLPWSKVKSWIGSLGMLLGGWTFAVAIVVVFVIKGIFPGPVISYVFPISLIAIAGTLVESLPIKDVDNITVTFTAVLLGVLLF